MASDALSTFFAARNKLAHTLFSVEAYYNVVEAAFLALVLYLALTRAYKPRANGPTTAERAQRLRVWKPAPLDEALDKEVVKSASTDVELASASGPYVTTTQGDELLNMATTNFLALAAHPRVTARAQDVLKGYGCGACGPRGFYGTTDIHLACEDAIAKFSDTNAAILYSFGAATGSSTVPAFCKRGDLIIVDSAVHYGLRTGVSLSRAQTRVFRHNDVKHLEMLMKEVTSEDGKHPSKALSEKRFVMIEGIYANIGDIAPLAEIVELKNRYGFRLILDESFSIGVLGRTGRGALERARVNRDDVDIAIGDLGNAIASIGGYCVGDTQVVSHQRLSGAGYCFSASQPPFLAAAVTEALAIVQEEGDNLTEKLRSNVRVFQKSLKSLLPSQFFLSSHPESPLMHIRSVNDCHSGTVLTEIQKLCIQNGVLIGRPNHVPYDDCAPSPSLRITIMAAHRPQKLREAAVVIADALKAHL